MTNGSSWRMTRSAKRMVASLLSIGMLGSLALSYSQANADPAAPSVPAQQTIDTVAMLTPKPNHVEAKSGVSFTLPQKACVALSEESLKPAVDLLNERLGKSYGVELSTAAASESCPIHIKKVAQVAGVEQGTQSNEAYKLDSDAQGVRIETSSIRGALWGAQTVLQLIGPWSFSTVRLADSPKIPGVHILDAPRYAHRGFMLDPSRSFYPVDEIKRIIDIMSYMKMNVLHLHISDDQGFRLEITNDGRDPSDTIDYTKLAKAAESTSFAANGSDFNPDPGRSGYYTQQEFIDLVAYAARHGVGMIPEVDGPGHSTGILHAIPQLNTENTYPRLHPGEDVARPPMEKNYTAGALDTELDATYTFMKHVMTQINEDVKKGIDASGVADVAMPYFHLGGDELAYPKDVPDRKTKQEKALQRYLGKTGQMVTESGKTPIVWNDGLAAADQLPEGSVVQVWIGNPASATKYAKTHHGKLILSPVKQTYLVQWPATDVAAPNWACRKTACSNQEYYNWDPTQFAKVPEESVLGIEPAIWTEHLRTLHDTEFMMYPRMFASAEVGWTLQAKRNYDNFASRVGTIGIALINGSHTFHLTGHEEIPSWFGQYKATYAQDLQAGSTVQIASIVKPGLTSTDGIQLTAVFTDKVTQKQTTLPVTLSLAQVFHYQDDNRSSGRFMNSPVEVKTVIPEEIAGQSGELVVTGVVPDSSRGTVALVPAFSVNSTSPMSIQAKEETSTPEPNPDGTTPDNPTPGTSDDSDTSPAPGDQGNPDTGTQPAPDQPDPDQPKPGESTPGEPKPDSDQSEPKPGSHDDGSQPGDSDSSDSDKNTPDMDKPGAVDSDKDDKGMTDNPVKPVDGRKQSDADLATTGSSIIPLVVVLLVVAVAGVALLIVRIKHRSNDRQKVAALNINSLV